VSWGGKEKGLSSSYLSQSQTRKFFGNAVIEEKIRKDIRIAPGKYANGGGKKRGGADAKSWGNGRKAYSFPCLAGGTSAQRKQEKDRRKRPRGKQVRFLIGGGVGITLCPLGMIVMGKDEMDAAPLCRRGG